VWSISFSELRPTARGSIFDYDFFGAPLGQALDIKGLAPARKVFNTRQADNTFAKVERANHVRLPQARFEVAQHR